MQVGSGATFLKIVPYMVKVKRRDRMQMKKHRGYLPLCFFKLS